MPARQAQPIQGEPDQEPRSRRQTPDEARAKITRCAVEFLGEYPFRDLTVARLMSATSLSRPSFYQYFTDIHDLILTLLNEVEAAMHATANPWIQGEGDPVEALWESLGGVVRTAAANGRLLRAVSEAAPLDDRLEAAWDAFMGRWHEAVEARIRAQQDAGLVPPFNARLMAVALNSLDASILISVFGRSPQGTPEQVVATLHHIWVGALYRESGNHDRTPRALAST